jgi:REP element-mobilizing transposase RayT
MSYTRFLYHIIFRTKNSRKTIVEQYEKELYAYIMGIVINKKSKLYRIGGTSNHIHLLVDIHPTYSIANFMKELKEYSSKWLSANRNFPDFQGWAVSYAGFTYNYNEKEIIVKYIMNQKEHHKTISFEEEYRQFLLENGIDIDERYFLKE